MDNAKAKTPGASEGTAAPEEKSTPGSEAASPNLKLHVSPDSEERGLDFILDVPLKVAVELGRAKILVQDLLKLHKGSVIELNKLAGEPLEILINERVLAKGEVIVVNEKFGIRLTDIVSHAQRIRNLGE